MKNFNQNQPPSRQAHEQDSQSCNDLSFDSLYCSVGEKLSKTSFNYEPYSSSFKDSLKASLFEKRHKKSYMQGFFEFLGNGFRSRFVMAVGVSVMILAIISTSSSVMYWGGQKKGFVSEIVSGFSELIIGSANAEDFFTLKPISMDSLGVDGDSAYLLTSKEAVDESLIKKYLSIKPLIDIEIIKQSNTSWIIKPKEVLPANTIMRIAMNTTTVNDLGEKVERLFGWAYQIKNTFKVIAAFPGDRMTGAPVNTGIEVTFSHDTYLLNEFEENFSIDPFVKGRFEKHGRDAVFVPLEPLKSSTVYSVTVKKGVMAQGSDEALKNDYIFSFETDREIGVTESSYFIEKNEYEFGSGVTPMFLFHRYLRDHEYKFGAIVYQFNSWQEYYDSLKKLNEIPSWTYLQDRNIIDVSKLSKRRVFTELPIVQDKNYSSYVSLPKEFDRGFYLVELSSGGVKKQVFMQITDLSSYVAVTIKDSLVWVNDLRTKGVVSGASVEVLDTEIKTQTGGDGAVRLENPENFGERIDYELMTKKGIEEKSYYLKIQKNNDLVIVPFLSNHTISYSRFSQADQNPYWHYLYKDKPVYYPNDTVQVWGFAKLRSNEMKYDENDVAELILDNSYYHNYFGEELPLIKKSISIKANGSFDTSFSLTDMQPGYYSLNLRINDRVVDSQSLYVDSYVKPAYSITLTPERGAFFIDDTVTYKGRVSFFDGTPAPSLALTATIGAYMQENEARSLVTDENGEVSFTVQKKWEDFKQICLNARFGECNPLYVNVQLQPQDPELGELTAWSNIAIYTTDRYIDELKSSYPQKGKGEVSIKVKFRNIDKSINELGFGGDFGAPDTTLIGNITKVTYEAHEIGTSYDFINKKTIKEYRYDRREAPAGSFKSQTDINGEYVYQQSVEPNVSYIVDITLFDKSGKSYREQTSLYYYDGSYLNYYEDRTPYYHLDFPKQDPFVGGAVSVVFKADELPLVSSGESNFLFAQLQQGLQEYQVGKAAKYDFIFEERDVPNVAILGVWFNGSSYITTGDGYYQSNNINVNKDSKKLSINVFAEKDSYKPGEIMNLTIETKKQNKPVSAAVNVNMVDEAIYSLVGEWIDPLNSLYSPLSAGLITAYGAHDVAFRGAEGGGCFAEGTMITLSDGKLKPIEKIIKGDIIKTFDDPLHRIHSSGNVSEVFEHTVKTLLHVNDELSLTPEHLVFAKGRFMPAGELSVGDRMVKQDGSSYSIRSLRYESGVFKVYNFRVDPQHTYFANGLYVHNDKSGGGVRDTFLDVASFNSVTTDEYGIAQLQIELPDNITSWRITSQAITQDYNVGYNTLKLSVSLPVFAEVTIGAEYLIGESPIARVRSYGTALQKNDDVSYRIASNTLGIAIETQAKAFTPAYAKLPELKNLGVNEILYSLKSANGEDNVKLPMSIRTSRLEKNQLVIAPALSGYQLEDFSSGYVDVILFDAKKRLAYDEMQSMLWMSGDRVDQKYVRVELSKLHEKIFGEKLRMEEFNPFYYQSGGVALLPYAGHDLELSARIALSGANGFDKRALIQYFYTGFDELNKEEMSWRLSGLAALGEPVLQTMQNWLKRDDLSLRERLFLANGLATLGASEWARHEYDSLIKKYAVYNEPEIYINGGGDYLDDRFYDTILCGALAAKLDAKEVSGLFEYVTKNQKFSRASSNSEKISERLFVLEKLQIINSLFKKQFSSTVAYVFDGEEHKADFSQRGDVHLRVTADKDFSFKIKSVQGDVMIALAKRAPIDLASIHRDNKIRIGRRYEILKNNSKLEQGKIDRAVPPILNINKFEKNDVIRVSLSMGFDETALSGGYQITDILPSGLTPIINQNLYRGGNSCWFFPYEISGQFVKFMVDKAFDNSNCSEFSYLARVKTPGVYKAEPAMIQSIRNPSLLNFSGSSMIEIKL